MADDKSKTGQQDRSRVAGNESYEVSYFAQKHGLTAEQARDLIDRHGPSRTALDDAAEKLKAGTK